MNSQNYYQSLLSDNQNREINQYNIYPNYRNKNDKDIAIMEVKEPSDSIFCFLESPDFPKSQNTTYTTKVHLENKKSNKIKKIILSLIQKKEEDNGQIERNGYYKTINLSRFIKPTYKKYEYMNYPFYKNNLSDN